MGSIRHADDTMTTSSQCAQTIPPCSGRVILVTGATGYVGSRLLRTLEAVGARVRCLVRVGGAKCLAVGANTEVMETDLLNPAALRAAMQNVHTAYYLIHSMKDPGDFEEKDRQLASAFATSAREARVRRIIYLGGLAHGNSLSKHLASRQEVGSILRESGVPTIEFRASVIIGAGSISFEMVRSLVERLPIMVTPLWVSMPAQPISIEDVIAYLIAALDLEDGQCRIFEIGGADRVSYLGLMQEYCRQRGLRCIMIPVPVLTPWLSSLWLRLMTPLQARVGRKLIEGVRNDTTVKDDGAARVFSIHPRGTREAIAQALAEEDRQFLHTRWMHTAISRQNRRPWGGVRSGSRIVDARSVQVPHPPSAAFRPIQRIGGRRGWYYVDWMWRLRALIDSAVGGVGMRRNYSDQRTLAPGDIVDFWRVEAIEPNHLLRLVAEMKLPGRAWLQFEVAGDDRHSTVTQTAIFDPVGLTGLLYWYLTYPIHTIIFAGMLRAIAKRIEQERRLDT